MSVIDFGRQLRPETLHRLRAAALAARRASAPGGATLLRHPARAFAQGGVFSYETSVSDAFSTFFAAKNKRKKVCPASAGLDRAYAAADAAVVRHPSGAVALAAPAYSAAHSSRLGKEKRGHAAPFSLAHAPLSWACTKSRGRNGAPLPGKPNAGRIYKAEKGGGDPVGSPPPFSLSGPALFGCAARNASGAKPRSNGRGEPLNPLALCLETARGSFQKMKNISAPHPVPTSAAKSPERCLSRKFSPRAEKAKRANA